MSKCKYETYTELFAAFESGELDKRKFVFMVDNDCICLRYEGDDMDEGEAYEYAHRLFRGSGYGDIEDILKAAGYQAEGV